MKEMRPFLSFLNPILEATCASSELLLDSQRIGIPGIAANEFGPCISKGLSTLQTLYSEFPSKGWSDSIEAFIKKSGILLDVDNEMVEWLTKYSSSRWARQLREEKGNVRSILEQEVVLALRDKERRSQWWIQEKEYATLVEKAVRIVSEMKDIKGSIRTMTE